MIACLSLLVYILVISLVSYQIAAYRDELNEAISMGATSRVRQLMNLFKKSSTSFPSIEPFLWMSLFRGNSIIFKLILKKSPIKNVLSSRHPRSGGTLFHAALFDGNHKIAVSLLNHIKGHQLSQSWVHIRDHMQGYTPFDALMHGYHHQWMNYHNTPLLAMLQGGRKDKVATQSSFNKTLKLILPHVLQSNKSKISYRKMIHQLLDVQWSDGVKLVLHSVGANIATWNHIVKSIQELFTLIVRFSKQIVNHGNVAVDQEIVNQFDPHRNGTSFNSFTFIGIPELNDIVHDPQKYSYDRNQLNNLVFDWHNRNILIPLLQNILFDGESSNVVKRKKVSCSITDKTKVDTMESTDTPLHVAAYMGYESGIHTLFKTLTLSSNKKCLDVWMHTKNSRGRTPLMSALASHSSNIFKFLQKRVDVTLVNSGLNKTGHQIWIDPWNITKIEIEVDSILFTDIIETEQNKKQNKTIIPTTDELIECNSINWNNKGKITFESYYRSNVPVIIKSHDLQLNWEGFRYWKNVTYFESTFPQKYFNVFGKKINYSNPGNGRLKTMKMKMREFIDKLVPTINANYSQAPPFWLVETDTHATNNNEDARFLKHVKDMTGRFDFYEDLLKSFNISAKYSNYQFMIAPKGKFMN